MLFILFALILLNNFLSVGLFESRDTDSERYMRHATERVNSNKTILPKLRLSAHIVRIQQNDNFHVGKKGKLFH